MFRARVLGVLGGLLLAACSDRAASPPEPPQDAPPAATQLAPSPPSHAPALPATAERDADANRIDDVLDEQLLRAGADRALLGTVVKLQVILNAPLVQSDLVDFVAAGGKVDYVFRELRYGFIGEAPLERVQSIGAHLASRLHLVAAPHVVVPFLDEATRTGRIRGIWTPGFAGAATGYAGNDNITIAVIDTGVDGSHADLNGRMQSWKDYTSDATALGVRDVQGHGTHVASIALGSGAAFGVGGGTLKFSQSGNLGGVPSGSYLAATVHTPAYLDGVTALSASASATFSGGPSTTLHMLQGPDPNLESGAGVTTFGTKSGASALTLALTTAPAAGSKGLIYQGALLQSTGVTSFEVANSIANYPSVGDGFNALRGVAPACQWLGAKVFTDAGAGTSFDIETALDDVASQRLSNGVKVMNLSLGIPGGGVDTLLRTTVNNAVDDGIVVVVAAGNDGPTTTIGDPGRASKVITVGASNDVNELTNYTSAGFSAPAGDEDAKPDLLAPGGSSFRSAILAADSNTKDGTGLVDTVANDYAPMQGTSMAAPFVSGSIALMIDALQQSGTTWSFSSSAQPLFLKMLLSASATELNLAREQGSGNDPSLGRASPAKDLAEGYGIINPDAAIEAMVQSFVSPLTGSVNGVAPARLEWERRAWGRKLSLVNGATVILNLSVPGSADYDLYLYSGTPDAKGNPVLRASSTHAGSGTDETISYASAATETAYMFVKRVSGFGAFSCTGSAASHCGDGKLDTGEQCDPALAGSATCCTSSCAIVSDGTSCSDGNACTNADSCQNGSCSGTPVVCAAADQCHAVGSCDGATGICSNPKQTDGTACDDKNQCTQTDSCVSGICAGKSPVTCPIPDQCHTAGACDAATGLCSNPAKIDGVRCDDGNKCTQSDSCQAGTCTGASPLVCAALDQCHDAGTCSPATGACSNPNKAMGSPCDDGDACTQTDACVSGMCVGQSPVTCPPPDECHEPGTCQPPAGTCSYANQSDGTACGAHGGCQAGSCVEPSQGAGGEAGSGGANNEEGGAAGASGAAAAPAAGGSADSAAGGNADSASSGAAGAAAGSGEAGVATGAGGTAAPRSPAGGEPATGGTAGSTSPPSARAESHAASGCGCAVPGEPGQRPYGALLLAGVAFTLQRRRLRGALKAECCRASSAGCGPACS